MTSLDRTHPAKRVKAASASSLPGKDISEARPYRKHAIVVGVFYLAATVAGLVGLSFSEPVLASPEYLVNVSASGNQVMIGALLELVMAVAVAGIAIAVYPVLRKYNPSIAIGYVGARLVESILFIIGVLSLLTLVTLSREFVEAGAPDAAYFQTLGDLLLAAREWGGHVVLDVAVFPLGALLFYSLLYRTALVPRWLAGLGLVGALMYWAAGILVMFHLLVPLSTIHIVLQAPLGMQELALALWLIAKGFGPPTVTSQSAESTLQTQI